MRTVEASRCFLICPKQQGSLTSDPQLDQVITFHIQTGVDHPFPLTEDRYISWLLSVAKAESSSIQSISYIFCSDEDLLEINIKYLGHDYYTDIITFPYQERKNIQSDMYISLERVAENAIDYNETFEDELRRVMVHGLLHLIGYGDKTEEETAIMRSKENEYMSQFT
jgi:probable rRNA maturation factor